MAQQPSNPSLMTVAEETAVNAAVDGLYVSPSTSETTLRPHLVDDVATYVLTDAVLVTHIGSFQRDPVVFVAKYSADVQRRKKAAGLRDTNVGFLVLLAITDDDLPALKLIHTARILCPEAAKNPELSFDAAMYIAASEGRSEILEWLDARAKRYPADAHYFPGETRLRILLRCGHMDIVRFFFDRREPAMDQGFMDILVDAFRRYCEDGGDSTGGFQSSTDGCAEWMIPLHGVFVQARPALHATLLQMVARAGLVSTVAAMLSPRSGVDTTKFAIFPSIVAAARGRHRDVAELLFAALREDEVIDVPTLREQLFSAEDTGVLF